ncbi:MAG TPA: RNB domain-containing ribonuclease, partial [Geobacterales bacterium]|nr:RNB domain-containing ribonuclease [Geobacterales bacterium]
LQLEGIPRELIPQLLIMKALAARLTERRRLRGSIDFDLPEPQVVLDLTGEAENIIRSERNLAHRLIEEFMLAANEAVAHFITDQGVPSLYRIHEPPDGERMAEVILFLRPFGFELPHHAEGIRPAELQKILASAVGRPEERLVHELILRSLKQARYAVQNSGHFGLAADCYTHFTSPIRRYPDLVIHRILKGIVANSLVDGERHRLKEELPAVAEQTSRRERVAMEAEREVLEFMRLRFMERHIGEEHEGIVVGVGSVGLYVELITYYVEGLVLLESLDDDTYIFEEGVHGVVGSHTGRLLRLGDRVRVRVSEVSWERRRLLLTLLAGGMLTAPTYVPRRPASRAKRRR